MIDKKKASAALLILIILLTLMPAASATNATLMSFSDLGLTGPQEIQLYQDGILVGTYNSSDSNITIPDHDFILVFKPELKSHWFNAKNFASTVIGLVQTNWEGLLLIAILIGLVVLGAKKL